MTQNGENGDGGRMKRAVLAAVCAMAVSAALWGCGGGTKDADIQGNGAESADAAGDDGVSGQREMDAGQESGGTAQEAAGTAAEDGGDMAQGNAETDGVQGGEETAAQLAGTSFSVLGDSISTYQGSNPVGYYAFFPENGEVADVEDTWWQRVADDLELTLYVNGSSSGATVAGDSTGTADPQCGCNELRTNDLSGPEGACPDRVVIYLGTNDMLKAIPLGDNDGTGLVEEGVVETFSDAYTLMLDKVQANYPLAEIYCCTLLPVGDYGTDTPYVEFVNGEQLTSADYGEAVARIAGSRGLPVIDLSDCGVTIENLHEMTSDGVHPTAAGMRCIAEAVEEAFAGPRQ
ncbi:MAG: SGNH/GDSL hydrolase family protein [Lachnospiraceae bacterium]|nr:SGNH/GDSL hydrolase family protein [Lachnospiraceae bacterium]